MVERLCVKLYFMSAKVDQGPVVQSFVSLTMSLRRQLVNYMPTTYANTHLFFVGYALQKILTFFQQNKCVCNIYF